MDYFSPAPLGKGEGGSVELQNGKINVTFRSDDFANPAKGKFDPNIITTAIAHEGSHVADAQDYLRTGVSVTDYTTEYKGNFVESVMAEATGYSYYTVKLTTGGAIPTYMSSWTEADKKTLSVVKQKRDEAVKEVVTRPTTKGGLYGYSPNSTTPAFP